MMTVTVIVAGLLPILLGSSTGSEITSRLQHQWWGHVNGALIVALCAAVTFRLLRNSTVDGDSVGTIRANQIGVE
nr:hypothetical protein [Cellvibrio sp. QJXJ]